MQARSSICQEHGKIQVPCYFRCAMRKKDPHAVALGRKGGKKGGKARWEGVTAAERSEILRRAALARWRKHKKAHPS